MNEKRARLETNAVYSSLTNESKKILADCENSYRLSSQQLIALTKILKDFEMWGRRTREMILPQPAPTAEGKNRGRDFMHKMTVLWKECKSTPPDYSLFTGQVEKAGPLTMTTADPDARILGTCPVASSKTRCCNLMTLDAVLRCGFSCSYCSIQSFYYENTVSMCRDLAAKLADIKLDPHKTYHIGTGQSSDSLMWGNKNGLLDDLCAFAEKHPNVILELKTKSARTDYLENREIPPNVLTTWSLNTSTIIKNEEHGTASLEKRLQAAARIASKGGLVGFHFHPVVYYQNWEADYTELAGRLVERFDPATVTMVSIGTITLAKQLVKDLRKRNIKTKILQMPLENAAGKLSYPLEIKKKLFSTLYEAFNPWHNEVYFYLCMEEKSLWNDTFGYEYSSNEEFEADMKSRYLRKINNRVG